MLIKKLAFVSLALSLVVLWAGSVAFAMHLSQRQILTLSELNKVCQRHLGKDGFGDVTLGSVNFQNQTGSLVVPCTLHIKQGSTFQMSNVNLDSKNLEIISDDSGNPDHDQPIHIILRHVKLTSKQDAFQIDASAPASTVVIQDSEIDYPNLVGVGTGAGDTDTSSSIEVTNTKMRAVAQDGQGIWLVSTGKTTVKDNKFELYDPTDVAVLLGNTCTIEHNTHANQSCHDF